MARLCAFKDPETGVYYNFNGDNLSSIGTNPDYSIWMDATLLNSLTQTQLNKIGGYDLVFYTDIEDDVYNINVSNYDVFQTTDTSHFSLAGYAYLSKMVFNDTTTSNHVILSFDGRKTWWYYNSNEAAWKPTNVKQIYTERSNTVAQINALTKDQFDLMFKKHCTLDFAMAINNSEYFGSVTLTLPPNQPPKILALEIKKNAETHKKKINIFARIDDMEGDTVSYKILRSFTSTTQGIPSVTDAEVESGDLDPNKTDFYFNLDPADFEIGTNTLKFTFTDEKGASISQTLIINKTNQEAMVSATLNGDKLTYSVIDLDVEDENIDGGWIRIINTYTKRETKETIDVHTQKPVTVTVNKTYRHIITPGYIDTRTDPTEQIGENQGWSDYIEGPIDFTKTIQVPWDTIEFGIDNILTIEYKEDIYNAQIKVVTIPFIGTYFGILFVDHTQEPYRIDGDPNKPNQNFYYSNSLGEVIKKINLNNVIHSQSSVTKEIGLINLTNDIIPSVTVKGFKNEGDNYRIYISTTETFDLTSLEEFTFLNVRPFNPDDPDGGDIRRIYVKLVSMDNTNWEVNEFVTASTASDTQTSPNPETP